MPINEKFLKPYDPIESEPRNYRKWEESGFFNPDKLPGKREKPFTIIMPPPNVTGVLHMGHALMLTLEDVLIRYKRMRGFKTLWLPGTDHAAIATQSRVEKDIYKSENKSRHDLGREEFLKRVEKFAQESHDTIVSQVKVMGASCDWSREAFTLDEKRSFSVRTMFKKMYDDGLIYRGFRIVNWDPKGQTTISDDEIVYEERKSKLYTFKYSHDFPFAIATTRPETKLGDVGVAVNPEDLRYNKYIGQTFEIKDFAGVKLSIKVIGDSSVEKDFGTGALGLTPAHSHVDWEMAEKNGLKKDNSIINEYGKMAENTGPKFAGKKVAEAREEVVAWLRENNLLEKEEEITQNVATAERTGGIIEPMPKLQWFIDVNKPIKDRGNMTLKEIMKDAVASNSVKILPEHFNKTYFHWIENLRDWCISRQI
jgi:valyl-tRNA synthetase